MSYYDQPVTLHDDDPQRLRAVRFVPAPRECAEEENESAPDRGGVDAVTVLVVIVLALIALKLVGAI